MRWAFVIQQKLKVAVLLLGVMLVVILFTIIERRNIEAINQSVTSIYKDRLVPATDIFYLTETIYNKRLEMEKLLSSNIIDLGAYQVKAAEHDKLMNSLVGSFQKTYLVDEESVFLKNFIIAAGKYSQVEDKIIGLVASGNKSAAVNLYKNQGEPLLTKNIHSLSALAKIQTKVGSELMNDSKGIAASSDLLSTLQMSVVIILGLMIVGLVTASKLVSPQVRDFNLN